MASSKEVAGEMEVDIGSVQPPNGSKNEINDNVRKKQRFAPVTLDNMFCEETFARYFIVEFTEEAKKCVNPYALIDEVETVTGSPPKRVFGNNRRSVTVEVSSKDQSEKNGIN